MNFYNTIVSIDTHWLPWLYGYFLNGEFCDERGSRIAGREQVGE